jgi:dTDP-glucose 4,6-dehydratase
MSSTPQRRVAVIGSNSFSGSDFIDHLLNEPNTSVCAISRSPEKKALYLPYLQRAQPAVRFVQADLNHDLPKVFRELDTFEPHYIVNFAAQSEVAPSWEHPDHWFQTNTVSLASFIKELTMRRYLKRYLHVSSPEVYGTCRGNVSEDAPLNPSTPYAASKAAADLLLSAYCKAVNFPLVTVRATNVYGAHQQIFKIIPRSIIRIRQGETIDLHGGGVAVKSFIHIRDASRGEEAIMEHGRIGEIYHLSPDQGYEVRNVVRRLCTMLGVDFSSRTQTVAERLGQDAAYLIQSTKAHQEFGWQPRVSLDTGLLETIDWIDRFWPEIQTLPSKYIHAA